MAITEKINDMDRKWCSGCRMQRSAEGGKMVETGKANTRRWKCASCLSYRTPQGSGPGRKARAPSDESHGPTLQEDRDYLRGCGYLNSDADG